MLNNRTNSGGRIARLAVLFSLILLITATAFAQNPLAGSSIGNQASATYTDASSVQRTATSNIVVTLVAQVGGVTMTPATNAKTGSPGAQVLYSHVITNTGNGNDTYSLALTTGGAVTMTNTAIYADANNDGIPDNNINLVGAGTVSLAPGASLTVLVVGTIPAGATSGQTGTLTPKATSVFDGTQTATDVDTTTVSLNAVINVTKSLSVISGPSPSTSNLTVTLTYTNNGDATATAVTLQDVIPAGMTYVTGSARWSVLGATPLTETGTAQGTSPTITYSWTAGTSTAKAIISSVPGTVSGAVTFQVAIASGLAPGAINNTATVAYVDGGGNNIGPVNTNTASYTVNQTAGVTIAPTNSPIASAAQGATVSFTNLVTNTGNGTDTFNITLAAGTTPFPAGTTFQLYKSDGVTPLADSNSDGIPDTGPLAKNGTYVVYVKATLPPASTGGPYNENVIATSTVLGTVTSTATDVLTVISADTVDLTGIAKVGGSGVVGTGAGSATIVYPLSTAPGTTVTFALYANNTAGPADSYNLAVSTTTAFPGSLPSGWSVQYRASSSNTGVGSTDCASGVLSGTISNTGIVNTAGDAPVCAIVTVPATAAPGAQNIYFQILSGSSGATDYIGGSVTVSTVHSVTVTPNNNGQVYAGGSVVYSHTITNNGNVTEATVTLTSSDNQSGFTSTLFLDTNGDGVFDAGDLPVSGSISLTAGQSKLVFAKVIAPPAASVGTVDSTTVTATYNGSATATATDSSTVIAGQLRLNKTQQYDTACNGTLTGGYVTTQLSAKPNTCLSYQITAVNQGTTAISSVVLSDATPANTVYTLASGHAASYTVNGGAAVTTGLVTPAANSAGTIQLTLPGGGTGTMNPNDTVVLTFEVQIN